MRESYKTMTLQAMILETVDNPLGIVRIAEQKAKAANLKVGSLNILSLCLGRCYVATTPGIEPRLYIKHSNHPGVEFTPSWGSRSDFLQLFLLRSIGHLP